MISGYVAQTVKTPRTLTQLKCSVLCNDSNVLMSVREIFINKIMNSRFLSRGTARANCHFLKGSQNR